MIEGSSTKCKNFIENIPMGSESFKKQVQFIFKYLYDSVTEPVIEICKTIYPETSSFYDRSDMLVFITIMSLLSGDTRDALLNWSDNMDPDKVDIELFKSNLKLMGYKWIDSVDVSFDELQRIAALMWPAILHNKGTLQSVLSVIKYCFMDNQDPGMRTEPVIDDIYILEASDSVANTANVLISSQYTRMPDENSPDYSDDKVIYHRELVKKLEEVRPMGIMYIFPDYRQALEIAFDGGSYYRHKYFDGVYKYLPYRTIEGSGIDNTKVLADYSPSVAPSYMVDLSVSYKYQIGSMNLNNTLSLLDMYYVDYSTIANIQFLSNNFVLFSNTNVPSWLSDGNGGVKDINDYNFREITRRGLMVLGNFEFYK